MNRPELYQKSVDVLLDAYNEGKLEHGNCEACAVGNIVNASGGFAYTNDIGYQVPQWVNVFYTVPEDKWMRAPSRQFLRLANYTQNAKKEIDQTGYSVLELAAIEKAFETSICEAKEGHAMLALVMRKKGQFIGLTAVLKVLAQIHQIDQEENQLSQERLETIYNKFQEA